MKISLSRSKLESIPIVLCNIHKEFITGINLYKFYDLFDLRIVPSINHWNASEEERLKVEILWVGLEEDINSEIIDKFPSLKIIATSTTGLTHLDLPYLQKKRGGGENVHLVSIKDERTLLEKLSSSAELAWSLMLVSLRQIVVADRSQHFTKEFRSKYFSRQVSSLSIGIVGFGRIGRQLARFSEAFGAMWYFYDAIPSADKELHFKELIDLVKESDVIFMCASIRPDFKYPILDAEKITKLKHGSIVVNIGRGSLIDEYAILESLVQKRISGYATDTLRLEELHQECGVPLTRITHLINQGHNLVVTPHIGGATSEGLKLVNENIMSQLIQIYREKHNE